MDHQTGKSQERNLATLLAEHATNTEATTQAQQLDAIIEALADGFLLYNAQGKLIRTNPKAREMLNLETLPENYTALEAAERRSMYRVTDSRGEPLVPGQDPLTRLMRGEMLTGDNVAELRIWRPDGQEIAVSISGTPLRDEAGNLTGFVCITRDVTARVQGEWQLRTLLNTNLIGVVRADAEYIVDANEAFLRMVGYSRAELEAGMIHWPTMTPPEYAPLDAKAIEESFTYGECIPFEKVYRCKDGTLLPVLIGIALIQRTPPQWVCYVLDLTEQKRLEQDRLEMLHMVAHELKTPLTPMKMRLQVAMRRLAAEERPDTTVLQPILNSINRMQQLVDDLLDGARLERGAIELHPEERDLRQLCQEAASEQMQSAGRVVELAMPKRKVMVTVDPLRITQVVSNLLSNALKYSPSESPVTLRLGRSGAWVRVSVTDQGPGIPGDAQSRLFERFYRVPGIAVRHGSGVGLGLGLYLCRLLVEAHGGELHVDSTVGQGSTFWFTLPL